MGNTVDIIGNNQGSKHGVIEQHYMVSVDEAKRLIAATCETLEMIVIPLESSRGYVLAEDIFSSIDLPPFNQSAMDGYALRFSDLEKSIPIKVVGEIAAGQINHNTLLSGQAYRIFTGAFVPASADTVVEQERVKIENKNLTINSEGLKAGVNIRLRGSQIYSGNLAMRKGTLISPAAIGFLAGLGINKVNVIRKPKIALVVTGSELQKPGTKLIAGNIFESNSIMLKSALEEFGFNVEFIETVIDDKHSIDKIFQRHLDLVDMMILTGGISVGDYDLIRNKLESSEFKRVFYKVKQKPGKPLWFGLSGNVKIFALPGNPASVLTCFYEYLIPALRRMTGHLEIDLPSRKLKLSKTYSKKPGLAHFLKAHCTDSEVTLLESQESYKLNSFSKANCLVYIPDEISGVEQNELVEVHRIME